MSGHQRARARGPETDERVLAVARGFDIRSGFAQHPIDLGRGEHILQDNRPVLFNDREDIAVSAVAERVVRCAIALSF